jgi:hypothetical protein
MGTWVPLASPKLDKTACGHELLAPVCLRLRASEQDRAWVRTFSIRIDEACKKKKYWNTKSTESLAQNHLAFDVVGGW